MDKITFVNGQSPYLSADNLNQMQTNIETAITAVSNHVDDIAGILTYTVDSNTTDYTISNLNLQNDFKISIDIPAISTVSVTGVCFNNISSGYQYLRDFSSGAYSSSVQLITPGGDSNGGSESLRITSRAQAKTLYDMNVRFQTGTLNADWIGGSFGSDQLIVQKGYGLCTQTITSVTSIKFLGTIPADTVIKIYKNR